MNQIPKDTLVKELLDGLNHSHRNEDKIKEIYNNFIQGFKSLDREFRFTSSFNEDYVYEQIEASFFERKKNLSLIPFGIKDIFNTKVLPTEMGSEIWKDFRPGNNARIVDEIIFKGGISFCKTTTAEFAVHYFEDTTTINPYNKQHITGTSSAGSAVAISCGALPVALATQTAGSIIRPSSFCGVFGFKPSFGALDRTGVLKTNDTLDTIGLMGADIEIIFKAFVNLYQNTNDYPLSKMYLSNYKEKDKKVPNVLFIDEQYSGYSSYNEYVKKDFEQIKDSISKISNVVDINREELNFINEIHSSHETIYDKSLSYYFLEESRVHGKISPIMQEIIKRGNSYTNDSYIKELKNQILHTNLFNTIMKKYEIDFILTPSTASYAPKIGTKEKNDTSLIWTYLGIPSINLPIFFDTTINLPYGLQVCSSRYNDFNLLKFSSKLYQKFS